MEVLAKVMVVTILQDRNVPSQHTVQLKLTQCYMTITPQFKK